MLFLVIFIMIKNFIINILYENIIISKNNARLKIIISPLQIVTI